MKTFRTTLLAAAAIGVAAPALVYAQDVPQDRNEHAREHEGDRGNRGARPDGGGRPDRGAQPQAAPQAQPAPQAQAPSPAQPAIRGRDAQRQPAPQAAPDRGNNQGRPDGRFAPGQPGNTPDVRGQQFNDRRDDRRGGPQGTRPDQARGFAPGYDRPGGYPGGYQRPDGNFGRSGGPGGAWRGPDWRQDRRYDWHGFRDQNRGLFRGSRYVAPRGWAYGYRRFNVGFHLPAFLFGSEYWIADPWVYRLPPVDGPYRWVRYYNDVLLIDLRSGEVVDEIPDFFW